MKVFAFQWDIVWEDKEANFSRVRSLVRAATPEPGGLLVLPEMFSTGFSLNLEVTRQRVNEDERFLAELARETGCAVIGSVVNPEGDRGCNEAVARSPDGAELVRYRKIRPFSLGGESAVHAAGSEVKTFDWGGFKIAPLICYDLRFPELFRSAAFQGAEMFVVMALWPVKRQQHWLTLLAARAIENQAYVVGVNRVGTEPNLTYAGRSVVVNPHGIAIADAGESEGWIGAEIQAETVQNWRAEFPGLRDARR